MTIQKQIDNYIDSQSEQKRKDLQDLNRLILTIIADCKLWFLDGKNEKGKVVTNPNIGYGNQTMKQAGGKTREFYQIGLSANTTGISVYILGLEDKTYLPETYANKLGKASVTGYCIKFKTLSDINTGVLADAIRRGVEMTTKA